MLLLLVLYLGITCSAKNPDYSRIIPVTAEGSTSLPCRHRSSDPVPLVLKLKMEEHSNHSWVVVAMTPIILMLDTNNLTLQLAPDNTSGNYSCSVDDAHLSELNDVVKEWITCRAPMNWTKMQWSRGNEVIAMAHRARAQLNVKVMRQGPSFIITSIINKDSGGACCHNNRTIKVLNATCQWSPPHGNATGWQLFLEGRYWIIVVVALSSALLCLLLVGGFVSIKRRRRVRRRAKSSFFKMSSAARNLYTESISPETDVAHKDQDFTYQNVSPSKVVGDDYYSDKGSFLSLGGDSYLEPMAEGGDQASDASGCYEDPTEDPDDPEDSIDGDCYENTNEEIKDGSEGSQSYEDMKGSICVRTKAEGPADEGTTQDEADADSYENMQTPLYSQPNWVLHPPHKSSEDQTEGTKGNLSEPATHQPQKVSTGLPQKVSTGLQEQNGDFYISYETNRL
ncbi:B-lymphocyte antigen CD19 isoform X2 [Phyllobates terribilis]|uniref:B-lymphocyte antigen CD19 isoform X2 n=1 Tax=Phyllobates terribilis TaxID=111132 RepID=UPI003CCB40A9